MVKRLALGVMRGCGVFALARETSSGMARILMYHNFCGAEENGGDAVSVATVRRQLEYLRRHFHIVPLTCIFERLKMGIPFDRLTTALTVDDGRRNCYEFLFPLLKEFKLPATFFVVTSFIRRENWLWTDKVLWLSKQPSRPAELSADLIETLFLNLNRMSTDARNTFIEAMAARMCVRIPHDAPSQYAPCSWDELREMADSGLVEIGSHTTTHPIFSSITDNESRAELTDSRAQIEEILGRRVVSFCFPNGKTGDYRPSQLQQVKDAGYEGAVVANLGLVKNTTNPHELPRLGVSGSSNDLSFAKDLEGIEHYQRKLQTFLQFG